MLLGQSCNGHQRICSPCGLNIFPSTLPGGPKCCFKIQSQDQASGSWGSKLSQNLQSHIIGFQAALSTNRHTPISFINKSLKINIYTYIHTSPIHCISLLPSYQATLDLIEGILVYTLTLFPPDTFCPTKRTCTFTRRHLNTSRDLKIDVIKGAPGWLS